MSEAFAKQIDSSVEAFRKLLCEQLARQEKMEQDAGAKDFSKQEKIVIGLVPGDGIGPILFTETERVLRKLVEKEIENGRIELRKIEGLTIENRLALGIRTRRCGRDLRCKGILL